jgi:hypothetical protein
MRENTPKTGNKRRGNRTSWQPGQTGNPGGRPRKTPEAREIEEPARSKSKAAIQRLASIVRTGKDSDAIRASEALLDRGFGRPQQSIEHSASGKGGFTLNVKVAPPEPKRLDDGHRGNELDSRTVVDGESQPVALPATTESPIRPIP